MNRSSIACFRMIFFALLTALVINCSSVNPDSPLALVDAEGNHPEGWMESHSQYAQPDGSFCTDCHGEDLAGGISSVSCFTDSFQGQDCHGNGPAFHPADWLNKNASGSTWHADSYENGLLINGFECVDCHTPPDIDDPDGGKCLVCHFSIEGSRTPGGWTHGVENHSSFSGSPEQAVCVTCHQINNGFGNGPFCHNCHGIASHAAPYLDHEMEVPTSGDFTSRCSPCHSISGTPATGAPVCTFCHVAGSPYTRTDCTSCHGRPPGSGEHGEHVGEASCDDCHLGAGSGSGLNHFYDGETDVDFSAGNSIVFNGSSCTGTCHGEEHEGEGW